LRLISEAISPEESERVRGRSTWPIEALGSVSDYAAFLDFAGVASVHLSFEGEGGGGIYHSDYDDFYWFTHFEDPAFVYTRALAQTTETAVMRLAESDLLPFNFTDLATTVRGYVSDLERLADRQAAEIRERNRQIAEGHFSAVAEPGKTSVPPKAEAEPPHLNFAPLDNGMDALSHSADRYQSAFTKAQQGGGAALARASLARVNGELLRSERALTDPDGLPGRPWFKHQLYAPGFYKGYGVKTIPAVREAIEQKQWSQADRSMASVGKVLENTAATIDRAATELDAATQ
jgi:N-acetylated-alpha-linked acidic dipeptidase